uniref:Acyl-coenzyme A oxidase n=1 Tax=Steinernema glaseri TaxID=37863 RepID=A0A1I8AV65_9BILA
MSMNSWITDGDNVDITNERRKATFSTDALSEFIYGGKDKVRRRREIAKYVDEHQELHDPVPVPFLSREERIENASRAVVALKKHMDRCVEKGNEEEEMLMTMLVCNLDGKPTNLQYAMFIPTLETQADEEQKRWWLQRAKNLEILGTYAQTELGHGTMLRRLETTATFDKASDCFVLHSPTVTSSKWWPGNLGKCSNYCIVVAQLYIDGKCYGPHTFMVQLRDEKTHLPLPGITVGDIGPKFGINSVDNGFLRFDHVKIPRRHMMMAHARVERDGSFVKPIHSKLSYGAMVFVRSQMTTHQAIFLAMAATITTRYSAIRRQGLIDPKGDEVQVLDYQTQQHRLFPQIARSFAFLFTGQYVKKLYSQVTDDIAAGNAELLPELHALTSGLKAVVTHQTGLGIEQCRMACGGHGYSEASGIPLLYTQAIGGCTYEGENMVMLLQTARFLMRAAGKVRAGKGAKIGRQSQVDYLFEKGPEKCRIDHRILTESASSTEAVIETFEHVARRLTLSAYDRLQLAKASGQPEHNAWNQCAVDLTKASRAHTRLFIAKSFVETVKEITDFGVATVMNDLMNLYLLYELSEMSGHLLEDGFVSGQQMSYIQNAVYKLLAKIRPNAVSIVDSFVFDDRQLKSVLGRRDGHVYENMLEWAKHSSLNKTQVCKDKSI